MVNNKYSILVVDDEPNNFDVIEAFLNSNANTSPQGDYQLHYVSNGQNAIASLDLFKPDLILLDVMMPEIDGIEVCKIIKAMPHWQIVPIIMVTALNSKSDLANCLNAGADDFISKPLNSMELRARVNSMLRIKQQYDDIQSLSHLQANTINILEFTLNELRGTFTKRISHELNTPLNGIIGTIGLLKDDIENMNIAEIREMLGWADESAQRLESLTNKFVTYLDLENFASQQKFLTSDHTKFSKALFETKLRDYTKSRNSSGNDENRLVFDLEEAEIALLDQYLTILLIELLDNALKFSTAGTMIKVSSQVVENTFNLSVHNLGRGMTEEQISRIAAFVQFDRKTYEQQGLGLGLKIVKKIVELASGKFSITSICEQETTVHISLPIAYSALRSNPNQEIF